MTTELDHLEVPLTGVHLIEASAGTGKTHTLAGLLLRLVVEHGLRLEQILAVTFTTAATGELRDRVRRRLQEARDAFTAGALVRDQTLQRLVARQAEPLRCAERLELALQSIDQAAVFTIHGFCQRVLNEHAFRSAVPFEDQLVTDPQPWLQEIADDFFRRRICTLPADVARLITPWLDPPEKLATLLGRVPAAGVHLLTPQRTADLGLLALARQEVSEFGALWRQERTDVLHLLRDPGLSGTVYGSLAGGSDSAREAKLRQLAVAIDLWLDRPWEALVPPNAVSLLSASRLQTALRKGARAPQHPLFRRGDAVLDRCTQLAQEMELWRLQMRLECLRFGRRELARRKAQRHVRGFDDLLDQVAQALNGPWGEALAHDLRRQYRALLVDEFQDTDQLQYRIFQRVWGEDPQAALFLIGDPKQAIYGFRGADVFAYLHAKGEADRCFTLRENWRAGPGVIAAVNALFAGHRPFGLEAIDFEAARPAEPGRHQPDAEEPLTLWLLEAEEGKAIAKNEAEKRVSRAMAGEIAQLIGLGAGATPPEHIAVLVHTNRQARLVKRHLARSGIPAVLHGAGSVLDSPMAFELLQILAAAADPLNEPLFLAALTTDTIGVEAQLLAGEAGEELEQLRGRFHRYYELWCERGVIHMLRRLMVQERVKSRLMRLPEGARLLTDLLHLSELLHRAATERHYGMRRLLHWFETATGRGRLLDPDVEQLRLESDARAVQILTIHRSKGLEFPVVFCPFAWWVPHAQDKSLLFHDPLHDGRLTLDLSGAPHAAHAAQARRESLSEQLRMLYVALTRAQRRLYLVWGQIKEAAGSALGYLLHGRRQAGDADPETWSEQVAHLPLPAWRAELETMARSAGGAIRLRRLPEGATEAFPAAPVYAGKLHLEPFSGRVARSWRISSFSAWAVGATGESSGDERPGQADELESSGDETAISDMTPSPPPPDIGAFPRGAGSGIFFHDLLERVDFAGAQPGLWQELVDQRLAAHGLPALWQNAVCSLLERLAHLPLPGRDGSIHLADVPWADQRRELEFYYPVLPVSCRRLARIFDHHGGGGVPEQLPERIERLSIDPARGFMRGFMDLVFVRAGRTYLIDWKSNHLGPQPEDYAPRCLQSVIATHLYGLQYTLYTLALHRFLRLRRPDYRYERDFGGVFFLFLRGIDPRRDPALGVHAARPPEGLIAALEEALLAEIPPDISAASGALND